MTGAELRDAFVVALMPNLGGIIASAFFGWSILNFVIAYLVVILLVALWCLLLVTRLARPDGMDEE
jgi:hypothetical protein